MHKLNLAQLGKTFSLLLTLALSSAWAADDNLHFSQLELTNGKTLKDVVVKSYDVASGKLLIVAGGRAQLVPLNLIPPPIAERLKKEAPEGGASTTVVAAPPVPVRKESASQRSTMATVPIKAPKVPAPSIEPAPVVDSNSPAEIAKRLALHETAARGRADNFFRFEFPAGSNSITVTVLKIENEEPKQVEGWPGRFRTQGKAYLEFFDSKGSSFQRSTSLFEVETEQKGEERPKVVSFRTR